MLAKLSVLLLNLASQAFAQDIEFSPKSGSPELFHVISTLTCTEAEKIISGKKLSPDVELLIFGVIAGGVAESAILEDEDWLAIAYGLAEHGILEFCRVVPDYTFLEAVGQYQWDRKHTE